ncbi:MAG: DUF4382 domain-containing protein, partial [Chloroflexota bacterium]|nr:DUF4382 domain-containing protein [Chloroflexota bacterium]
MRKFIISSMAVAVLISGLLVGCGSPKGTLQFKANGEDFVRQGFVSKDGWAITFEHIYVNLADVTAYQADPPYDPHEGGEIKAETEVALEGTHTVDLAKGDENASPILVGEVTEAPTGHYNAISWKMIPASSGPADGHSLIIDGTAKKDDQVIQFAIKDGSEYLYACGEYVGDERKGFVEKDSPGEVEMTFHFDHIFG